MPNEPKFVSRAVRIVEETMPKELLWDDFVKWVNAPDKFSKATRRWLRIDEFLANENHPNKVYRRDFLEYVKQSQPKLQDVPGPGERSPYRQFSYPHGHGGYGEKFIKFDPPEGEFVSKLHWQGAKNILAHTRWTEQTIGGRPALVLEEIQSEWHQDAVHEGGYGPGRPEAPLATTWVEYMLKKMLIQAVTRDYDYLCWVTSKELERRFGVADKTLAWVEYAADPGEPDNLLFRAAFGDSEQVWDINALLANNGVNMKFVKKGKFWSIHKKNLRFFVAIPTARQMAGDATESVARLNAHDIKFPTGQLSDLYDRGGKHRQNMVKAMERALAPLKAKVQELQLDSGAIGRDSTVWGVELTPEIKDWAMSTVHEFKEAKRRRLLPLKP